MINNFLIWFKLAKNSFSVPQIIKFTINNLLIFILLFFAFNRNVVFSIVVIFLFIITKLLIKFIKKYNSNILLPINPLLYALLVKPDIFDILIVIPILIIVKIKSNK